MIPKGWQLLIHVMPGDIMPEEMKSFFDNQVEGYDKHMADNVESYAAFYSQIAGIMDNGDVYDFMRFYMNNHQRKKRIGATYFTKLDIPTICATDQISQEF